MSTSEIVARLRSLLEAEPDLEWAYLFGSAARGERYRDVDVAVMPGEGAWPSLLDLGRLITRLGGALGVDVDVVDLRAAAPVLAGPMLGERILLLDRAPARRTDWEATMASRWLDFRSAWEEFQAVRAEALRQRRAAAR